MIPVAQRFVGNGPTAYDAFKDCVKQIRATPCWQFTWIDEGVLKEQMYHAGLWPKEWSPGITHLYLTLHGEIHESVADDPKYRAIERVAMQ